MKNKSGRELKILISGTNAALILALIFACFALTACDPSTYYFDRSELSDVVSVELINYDNPEQREFSSWIPDHSADLKPFNNSKTNALESLAEDKIPDFLDKLCECDVLYLYYAYDSPNGICIKLTYADGSFVIIWSNYQNNSFAGYIGKFTSEGEVDGFIGSFSSLSAFEELVNGYFETKI